MISSTNFLNNNILPLSPFPKRGGRDLRSWLSFKTSLLLMVALFLFPCLANTKEMEQVASAPRGGGFRIAVFPVENLSGMPAPLKEVRQVFVDKLKKEGVHVLEEEALEKFMAKHRIRYTGGINGEIGKAFKQEINISGVLITSLELYNEMNPPKISLISRLVSTGDIPSVLWMESVGMAGDDSPGILGLGLIEDPKLLLDKVMKSMFDSLGRYLLTKTTKGEGKDVKRKYRPKISYRSPAFDSSRSYTVAVIPFFNRSERKYAAEILTLHFIRQLRKFENFKVIEPGMVRQEFLNLRIIMEDGISLSNADAVFALLDADLIVSGRVMDYQDYQGIWGKPKVDFSAVLIERKSREIVWGSNSYNEGDDGVFFFDRGRVNTASAMASQMVQWIGEKILENHKRVQVVK